MRLLQVHGTRRLFRYHVRTTRDAAGYITTRAQSCASTSVSAATIYTALSLSFSVYRAMHFSAKRGIAIACRLSVRLSVCLSVCNVGEL